MRTKYLLLGCLVMAVAGCSKKAPPAAATPETPAAENAEVTPKVDDGGYDPAVAGTVSVAPGDSKPGSRDAATPAKNWDAVVAEIVQLRSRQRTPAQGERLIGLEDELVGALNSDPKAREAHQNLSRLINGR